MTWQIGIVIALCAAFLVFAIVSRRRQERSQHTDAVPPEDRVEDAEAPEDFNEKFFRNFSGGDVVQLVRTYQSEDYMLLRSILDGAGILTYSEFEQMNSLFPGVPIAGYSQAYISVPENDVGAARAIVGEYIENKRISLREQEPPQGVPAKIVKGLLDVQGYRGNLPELLVGNQQPEKER